MKISLPIIVCLSLLITGCTTIGKDYDETKTHEIVVGQTTESQLVEWFGQPESRTRTSVGDTALTWSHYQMKLKAGTFIPVLGAFIGGSDHESISLVVVLGADSIVKSFAESSDGHQQNH
tara:strand:+ start:589 stop:948 length:360 start_codon:yes stop_codon:yes gene_type:complete